MLGLAMMAAGAVFGRGCVRRLGWSMTRLEAVALAGAFALVATPWLLFLAAWIAGFELGLPAGVALLAASGWALGRRRAVTFEAGAGTSVLSWIALALLLGLLFHGHMLHAEGDGLYTGGVTYGDLALHSTLASRFASAEVDFDSPIVAGEALTYPFLGDFLVGCLVRGGWSLSNAFAITGWLSAMVGLALVQALALRLFARRSAATIAVWTIICSGALVGLWHAAHDLSVHGLPASAADMPNYANNWDRGVAWSNLVCDFLLPQRAFLAAFPALWAAITLLRAATAAVDEGGDRARARRLLLGAAVVIGALPFLHVHSFLLGIGWLGWFAIWRSVAARRVQPDWWLAVAAAIVIAAPQLAWQFGESWGTSFGRWNLGWRARSGEFWSFWLRNWGLPLALLPVACWHAWRARGRFAAPLVAGALLVFVAANLYQFQPHDWDNMKFFVYVHMAVAIVLAGGLAGWLSRDLLRRVAAATVIVLMTGSGALALVRELDRHDRLASTADVVLARELRDALPADARVLTSDKHHHVVPMLAGRKIVMGYRGWLWTHGIDVRRLEADVGRMFAGGEGVDALFRRHGVSHVFIGPDEVREWRADRAWFEAHYRNVLWHEDVLVVDVRDPLPARVADRGR